MDKLKEMWGDPFKLSEVMIGHNIVVSVTSLYTLICFAAGLWQVIIGFMTSGENERPTIYMHC